MIQTTGQTARITRSIIAGQPRMVDTVAVVSVDGDTLTYTADGVWFSTVTRSDITDWELVEGDAMQALDTFRVSCSYCNGEHAAIAGTYHDGSNYNGRTVYGVACEVTGTRYGLLSNTNARIF